jgi:hypothetical protein
MINLLYFYVFTRKQYHGVKYPLNRLKWKVLLSIELIIITIITLKDIEGSGSGLSQGTIHLDYLNETG